MTNRNTCDILCSVDADLAHLVERDLAKVEVAGSSPVIRSKKFQVLRLGIFLSKPTGLVYHPRIMRYIITPQVCIKNCRLDDMHAFGVI